MKLLALLLVPLFATIAVARPADTRAQLEGVVEKLRDLDQIEPARVAKLLGAKAGATTDVTPYRHETKLTLARFDAATVVVGGQADTWRIVELVPDPKLAIELADATGPLAKLPHTSQPRIVETAKGPRGAGTTHRYHVAHHDLVIDLDAADKVERIILTNEIAKW